jgi:hypothetical protein
MICTDSAGDVDNARLSYQNALADEVGQLRPELWHFFMEFESCYGSIQDILAVESRWAALFPQEGFADTALASIDRLRRRYTHFDLWPCTLGQRDYLQRLLGPEEAALLEMCASAGWALLATFACDACWNALWAALFLQEGSMDTALASFVLGDAGVVLDTASFFLIQRPLKVVLFSSWHSS